MDAERIRVLLARRKVPVDRYVLGEEGSPLCGLMSFGHRKIQEQYPTLAPNDAVAEVEQSNFGITTALDEKPIIATPALFTCIGLLGYDELNNMGFLMHFQPSNSMRGGLERLYQELARTHPNLAKVFNARIVASSFHDYQNRRELSDILQDNPSSLGTTLKCADPIDFVPDMKREEGKPGEGVALDTRDGRIFAYLRDAPREGPCDFKYNIPIPQKWLSRL